MALEIERRFLIKNDHWKEFITNKTSIEQGYLSYNLEDWIIRIRFNGKSFKICLLYTSPSPRDRTRSRMPSSA